MLYKSSDYLKVKIEQKYLEKYFRDLKRSFPKHKIFDLFKDEIMELELSYKEGILESIDTGELITYLNKKAPEIVFSLLDIINYHIMCLDYNLQENSTPILSEKNSINLITFLVLELINER